ncbi:hypothetical protein ACWGLG_43080 [Streptomyces antimycoticus]
MADDSRWATGHRRRMREILGPDTIPVYDAEWEMWELVPVPGPEGQTVLRETSVCPFSRSAMRAWTAPSWMRR